MSQEEQLKGSGARFRLKYLGNVAVSCSMRQLMEETERDRIVQECIYMVCSHTDLKLVPERPIDDYARNLIGQGPLKIANKSVDFVITATALTLVDGDPASPTANQVLNKQMLNNVSIATPGRGELDGYIAYMVKLKGVDRRCMVYECNTATATAILALIKKAFSIINKTNGEPALESPSTSQPVSLGPTSRPSIDDEEDDDLTPVQDSQLTFTDKPYVPGSFDTRKFNVNRGERTKMPGSLPPRFKIPRLPNRAPAVRATPARPAFTLQPKALPPEKPTGPLYVNTNVEYAEPPPPAVSVGTEGVARGLDRESWFHGVLSRVCAEQKLVQDGDYLVRQSENAPGQYVLSGMQANQARHILLIDNGKVRTRDQEFESIIALICFHRDRKIPITSDDSALMLNRPIPR